MVTRKHLAVRSFWAASHCGNRLCATRSTFCWTLAFGLAVVFGACEQHQSRDRTNDEGLNVVRAGESPARAPGSKGIMIDMDSDEVRVILVAPNGPAAEAGFAPGDRILTGDGQSLSSEDDLKRVLAKADEKKIFFEVRSGKQLLTLALTTSKPGWLILSGDTFKGYLLTRIQSARKVETPPLLSPAPDMKLPTYDGPTASVRALRTKPGALLFWGTFSEPCYAHLQAFHRACRQHRKQGLQCMAVNTMELFTAVGKTEQYALEMAKVRRQIYPSGTVPVDLFMESERQFGISKIPSLVLIDEKGRITGRHDGPHENPFVEIPKALETLVSNAHEASENPDVPHRP